MHYNNVSTFFTCCITIHFIHLYIIMAIQIYEGLKTFMTGLEERIIVEVFEVEEAEIIFVRLVMIWLFLPYTGSK